MERFRYLEHTADLKFEALGESIGECFENAALAMFSAMLDIKSVGCEKEIPVFVEASSWEELLQRWLSELLFLFETERMVFSEFEVEITEGTVLDLNAKVRGEKIDSERHKMDIEIKAVTYHGMKIDATPGKSRVQVLCDT